MMKKYVFMVVLGVITFGFSTQSFSKVRKIKKVNDVTTVTEVESKTAVEVKEKLKVSVGVQQVNAITEDKQNIFNITQRTLNVSTFYQWDPKTTFSILIPYHMETGENTLPTVTDEAKIIEHKYFGRVEVGAQQELFSHSNIGTVSGMVNLALPTMSGFSQKLGYENFNHLAAHFGAKNKLNLIQWPVTISGSLIYKAKSAVALEETIVDFGDEIVASIDGEYRFTHSAYRFLNPVSAHAELQYAYVAPVSVKTIPKDEKSLIITTQETKTGASAVLLNNRINYAYSSNMLFHLDSQFALMRSELPKEANKLAPLWGSVQNSGKIAIQLGITLGIL